MENAAEAIVLSGKTIYDLLRTILFEENEPTDGFIKGLGPLSKYGFHPERLKENAGTIRQFLSQLSPQFQTEKGAPFLEAEQKANGEHWGSIEAANALFTAGNALELVEWKTEPGIFEFAKFNLTIQ